MLLGDNLYLFVYNRIQTLTLTEVLDLRFRNSVRRDDFQTLTSATPYGKLIEGSLSDIHWSAAGKETIKTGITIQKFKMYRSHQLGLALW